MQSNCLFFSILIAGILGLATGCSPATHEPGPEVEPLSNLLSAYLAATHELKHAPRNIDELKKFLPDGEKSLVSPRDGKPYVIRWGVSVHDPNLDPANPPLVAYEAEGKNGVRHAINVMGLAELSDADFAKLPPP